MKLHRAVYPQTLSSKFIQTLLIETAGLLFFSFSKDFQREIIINILDESFLKLMFLQQQQQQQQQQNVLLN